MFVQRAQAMTIIVETGAGVSNANSYVSGADFVSYAESLGVTLSQDVEPMLVKAAQFIDSHDSRMKGYRSERDQAMAFPRVGVVIEGWRWNSDEIPRNVTLAQMAVALDIADGIDPYNPPQSEGVGIKRKRVEGAVEIEYAVSDSQKLSRRSRSQALLNSFLSHGGLSVPLVMA